MIAVRSLVVSAAAAAALAAPVITPIVGGPEPVEPLIQTITVSLASAGTPLGQEASPSAAGPEPSAPVLESEELEVEDFSLLGVTWPEESGVAADDLRIEVRVDDGQGFGDWTVMPALEEGPDPDTEEGRRAVVTATAPLWVGSATAVQTRVQSVDEDARVSDLPDEVELRLVDPGESATDGRVVPEPASTADAAAGMPDIITRAEWGADEGLKNCGTSLNSTIKGVIVHHTAGGNAYSTVAQAKAQLRADYAYHTTVLGWCDLGYNFVVDKWGNIYEGRSGGVTAPVQGAHAGGFNTDTVGISALGNYSQVAAPRAMVDAITTVAAWKLGMYGRDPRGKVTLTSQGGGTAKYPAGQRVSLDVISGHRDVGDTECPGVNLYGQLTSIRADAAELAETIPASLARASANPTVYVVSEGRKYPVQDASVLADLAPLGTLEYVSSAYLETLTTGPMLGRFVIGHDGAVWFLDRGSRGHVPQCWLVEAFGSKCSGLPSLSDAQLSRFPEGPDMSQFVVAPDRKVWFVDGGSKAYVPSCALVEAFGSECSGLPSLGAAALSTVLTGADLARFVKSASAPNVFAMVAGQRRPVTSWSDLQAAAGTASPVIATLTGATLSELRLGARLLRPGTLTRTAANPRVLLVNGLGSSIPLESFSASTALGAGSVSTVEAAALGTYPASSTFLTPAVACGTVRYIGVGGRLRPVGASAVASYGISWTVLDPLTCTALRASTGTPAFTGGLFVKADSSPVVYQVSAGVRRPVQTWAALVRIAGTTRPTIVTFGDTALATIPTGPPLT